MSVNLNHSIELRPATPADAPRLLEIYRPYVEKTAISFELALPTPADFCDRIRAIMDRYPYYVADHRQVKEGIIPWPQWMRASD